MIAPLTGALWSPKRDERSILHEASRLAHKAPVMQDNCMIPFKGLSPIDHVTKVFSDWWVFITENAYAILYRIYNPKRKYLLK